MNSKCQRNAWIIARLLLSAMFVESFIDKMLNWHMYMQQVADKGIPFPAAGLAIAAAVECFGSLTLITGRFMWAGAFVLAAYTFALGFIYFDFWHMDGLAAVLARKQFLKDFSVIGGLLLVAVASCPRETNP